MIAKSKIGSEWNVVGHSCHYVRHFQQLTAERHTFRANTHSDRFITDAKGQEFLSVPKQKQRERQTVFVESKWMWSVVAKIHIQTDRHG